MNEGVTMQLYHFPSANPQKVTVAFKELGLDCELVPVDLSKGEQRQPAFLAHCLASAPMRQIG
jgi:GST-like protein